MGPDSNVQKTGSAALPTAYYDIRLPADHVFPKERNMRNIWKSLRNGEALKKLKDTKHGWRGRGGARVVGRGKEEILMVKPKDDRHSNFLLGRIDVFFLPLL